MPNSKFNSFFANYWSAINCKKIRFCIPKTVLNFTVLKLLLRDCYIWSFKLKQISKYEVSCISLHTSIKFNHLICYSTPKRVITVDFDELLILTKTGGYFVLSTPFGILNDSEAWNLWVGGVLLFSIF